MDRGYIAGSLFKEGDQKQRMYEKEILQRVVGDKVFFFNPLSDNPDNDKSTLPTAQAIFNGDTERVIESKYIMAEYDGEDAGVMGELGVAWGINFMRDALLKILFIHMRTERDVKVMIEELLQEVPHKEVYAHLSDIRCGTNGDYDGKYVPIGFNQYMVGMIEQMGKFYPSFDHALVDLATRIHEEDREEE